MANPATPGAAPATPQSPANTPIGPVEILDKSGVSQGTFDAKAKPVAANVNWAPAEPPDFTGAGAFKINDQWATTLRYDVTLQNGAFSTGTIVFMNGRRQLATLHIASRDEARDILGVRNVEQIEAGRGKSARSVAGSGTIKGKLQSGDLAYQAAYKVDRMPSPVSAAQGYDSIYLLAAAITQAGSTDGRKIKDALESLNTKVEGVVTIYDKPFSKTDHEAITNNIPVFGEVKDGRVQPAHAEDIAGDKAVRVKPRA